MFGKRWFLILLPCVVMASCDSPAGPASDTDLDLDQVLLFDGDMEDVVEAVSGSGHFMMPRGLSTFSFHAVRYEDGTVEGRWQHRRHYEQGAGAKRKGYVTCFSIVGNRAWLGGIVDHANNPTVVDRWTRMTVIDNGEGKKAEPDMVSTPNWTPVDHIPQAEELAAAFCEEMPEDMAYQPIIAGNAQIKVYD
jgi:hypothetical protein